MILEAAQLELDHVDTHSFESGLRDRCARY